MTTRTQQRRLAKRGYRSVTVSGRSGWVPERFAERILEQVAAYQDDVQKLLDQPAAPRGRPRTRAT